MSLRIALVIDKYDPAKGGAEGYVRGLALGLADRGHDVSILARDTAPEPDDRITVIPISAPRHPKWMRLLGFVRGVENIAADGNFDVVHGVGYNTGVTLLNPHSGVEQSWIEGDDASRESFWGRLFGKIRRGLMIRHYLILRLQRRQYTDPTVRAIVAISGMIKDDMIRFHTVDPERIRVVFNGVDIARFHPRLRDEVRERERSRLGVGEDEIVILLVANNFRLKGVLPAVRMLPRLSDLVDRPFRLFVVGRGDTKKYLKEAKRLGVRDRIRFLDYVPDMPPLYAAADIYYHPTFYDSCSLVVLEAFAAGLPVITTVKNGASGAITEKAVGRVLTDPRNVEETARALAAFFPRAARERALEATMRLRDAYDDTRNIDRIEAIYHEIADNG
ncbi:MAG: glycosyltransferase family 4 protein [Deltaproteobacteria bacterium]|nr:glycosyltransferase family 4 protein [Candidatus Zymogenaceae bacterium]